MAEEYLDISYEFADWDDVDPGDGIPFDIVLAAEAVGVRSEGAIIARLALLKDVSHTAAYAKGQRPPNLVYLRFAGAEQAAALGASLIRASEQLRRGN